MMDYVLINGVDTRVYGLTCTALPPKQIPVERVNKVVIPGRSGVLSIRDDSYDPISKTVGFFYDGEDVDVITKLFRDAATVVFSDDPTKMYKCSAGIGSGTRNIFAWKEFSVTFECDPERRDADPQEIVLTSGMVVRNAGNRKTRPTFEVTGSGTVVLSVGSQTVTLTSVSGTFVVDGEIQECYSGSVSKNANMTGAFPVFLADTEYAITWTGSATVLMRPNWRYL